jgi:hypothetical protein
MNTAELVIWSAMLGGLVAIASFALIDALIRHRVASRRAFLFVVLTGSACVRSPRETTPPGAYWVPVAC